MCLWAIYIPRNGPHISFSRNCSSIVGIYNSLTDTWMWKLGLRPRYSFSGNICFQFSAFFLCSGETTSPCKPLIETHNILSTTSKLERLFFSVLSSDVCLPSLGLKRRVFFTSWLARSQVVLSRIKVRDEMWKTEPFGHIWGFIC